MRWSRCRMWAAIQDIETSLNATVMSSRSTETHQPKFGTIWLKWYFARSLVQQQDPEVTLPILFQLEEKPLRLSMACQFQYDPLLHRHQGHFMLRLMDGMWWKPHQVQPAMRRSPQLQGLFDMIFPALGCMERGCRHIMIYHHFFPDLSKSNAGALEPLVRHGSPHDGDWLISSTK